jgi:AcrR family transcriptional regulator
VNRHDILIAAANVFRRKGYHGTKMADIAAEVDLTAGSLYHHFPDGKQQILREVLTDGLAMVTAEVQAIVEDNTLTPDEKFRKAVYAHIMALAQNVSVAAALVFETRNLLEDQSARDSYLQRRDSFEQLYRQVIHEGIEAGVFRHVDVPIFTKALLGSNNWVGVWFRPTGRLSGEEVAMEIADIFLNAVLIKA